MTREEAVARIKDHIEIHRYHEQNAVKIFEALDMAIKALEQSEIIRCKGCINHYYEKGVIPYCGIIDYGYGWKDDDFCSHAERREEGEG